MSSRMGAPGFCGTERQRERSSRGKADQPENAARCAELECGLTVDSEHRTPEATRAAVRTMLAEPKYRQTAQRLRTEMRAMPGLETAVKRLEQLKAREQVFGPQPIDQGVSGE